MKILEFKPLCEPEVKEIDGSLKSMQTEVDGYIQTVYPFDDEIALICNEEGKLIGLPLNRALYDEEGNIMDVIAGTFFICGAPSDDGSFKSIPEELIDKYTKHFWC